jgi:hypothetical protein
MLRQLLPTDAINLLILKNPLISVSLCGFSFYLLRSLNGRLFKNNGTLVT